YYMGTAPIYLITSAFFRMTRPPVILGGIAILWGYFSSLIKRAERYQDRKFRKCLRSYQWSCLIRGKRAATDRLDSRQAQLWTQRDNSPTVMSPGILVPSASQP